MPKRKRNILVLGLVIFIFIIVIISSILFFTSGTAVQDNKILIESCNGKTVSECESLFRQAGATQEQVNSLGISCDAGVCYMAGTIEEKKEVRA